MWSPQISSMESSWSPHYFRQSLWTPCGAFIDSTWTPHGVYGDYWEIVGNASTGFHGVHEDSVKSTKNLHGLHEDSMETRGSISYYFPIVSIDSMWSP